MKNKEKIIKNGPTGSTMLDLPSPYEAHSNGLLHLPRFIAKIKKFLNGDLPESYRRNFTKGFDGFLCLHLGVDANDIIECVKYSKSDHEINIKLDSLFTGDLKASTWNRKVVQMGMSDLAREKLNEVKNNLNAKDRDDLLSFADIIDFDEEKIT